MVGYYSMQPFSATNISGKGKIFQTNPAHRALTHLVWILVSTLLSIWFLFHEVHGSDPVEWCSLDWWLFLCPSAEVKKKFASLVSSRAPHAALASCLCDLDDCKCWLVCNLSKISTVFSKQELGPRKDNNWSSLAVFWWCSGSQGRQTWNRK